MISMIMKKAAKFTITGTVQAVFFRQFCKEKAEVMGLRGYVRNLESGDVEILAEGEKEKIEEFYKIMKQGPPYSQIRNVGVEEKKWSGDFSDFKIIKF